MRQSRLAGTRQAVALVMVADQVRNIEAQVAELLAAQKG